MFGLSSLYVKLIGGALAALMLLGLIADRARWMKRAHNDEAQWAVACQLTRDAANNPKMDCKNMPQQISILGDTVKLAKEAIAHQNAAVSALATEAARQKDEADRASRKAVERARAPEATSARLEASARAGERLAKPCEPSKALEGAWR